MHQGSLRTERGKCLYAFALLFKSFGCHSHLFTSKARLPFPIDISSVSQKDFSWNTALRGLLQAHSQMSYNVLLAAIVEKEDVMITVCLRLDRELTKGHYQPSCISAHVLSTKPITKGIIKHQSSKRIKLSTSTDHTRKFGHVLQKRRRHRSMHKHRVT